MSYGFIENTVDRCIYMKVSESKFIILVLYIDDILLLAKDFSLLHDVKKFLSNKFEIKDMGEASYMIGIEILCNRSQKLLGLSQKGYINKILLNFILGLDIIDNIDRTLRIYCDNYAIVLFSKNDKYLKGIKCMELKYLSVKEEVHKQKVSFKHIGTNLMIVDPLTKCLLPKTYVCHVEKMEIM